MHRFFAALLFLFGPISGFAKGSFLITAGPEIFQFIRDREGGTHQEGPVNGIRVGIDRIKGQSWYVGADYLFAHGRLKGETATGRPLRSELTDQIFEARLGYTLQQKTCECPFFTPFGGWGYFKEVNDFHRPSPLPCKFTDTFNYFVVGFLSGVNFTPLFTMGINFKLKFMQNAKSKVSDDPLFEDVTLMIKDEIHVRLDTPFFYSPCNTLWGMGFLLSPFFEYRHFGGREGFPFNFKDTKFYLYGARFALTYRF